MLTNNKNKSDTINTQSASAEYRPELEAAANNEIKGEVENPHQASDIKPDEIVEPDIEPPEPEEEAKEKEVKVIDEHKVSLPEVYLKGAEPPIPVDDTVLEPLSDPPKEIIPGKNKRQPEEAWRSIAEPAPLRSNKKRTEDFNVRFREKLKTLLEQANKKRLAKVENNLKKIMDFAYEWNAVTNNDVERIVGVKNTQAYEYLKILVKQGRLVKFGSNIHTFYKPTKR